MEKQLCGEGRDQAQRGRPHPLLASRGRAQKVGEVGEVGDPAALQVDLPPPGEPLRMLPIRGFRGGSRGC